MIDKYSIPKRDKIKGGRALKQDQCYCGRKINHEITKTRKKKH